MGLAPAIGPGGKTQVEPPGFLALWQLCSGNADTFAAHLEPMNAASLKQNKWLRRTLITLIAFLALCLVAWLAVPPIAQSQVQKMASEKLGRTVTVGKIEFNPFTLELTAHDLRIAGARDGPPQLQIARIYIDAAFQSVLRLAPVLDAVQIDQPAVRVTRRADGSYDFEDVLAKLKQPPPEPDSKPQKFALYNIDISGGSVEFDDQSVKRTQELRDLVLKVPFLSNLDSKREIKIEPKLAFTLNGSAFDSSALSTPFAVSRKTDAQLHFEGLDLVPYLGYLPAALPVKLQAGTLDADLKIDFAQATTVGLKITGTVEAHGARLADAVGRDLLGFDSLKLTLADVRPLDDVVHLSEVALAAPQLAVARDAAGKLNLLATDAATGTTRKIALPAEPAGAGAPKISEKSPWRVQVDKLTLQSGKVDWRDATTQPAAAVDVSQLDIEAHAVTWPIDKPVTFKGSAAIGAARLKFKGEATDKMATVATEVAALPLSLAAPYLAQSLEPTLDGKLSGQIDVNWKQPELNFKAHRVTMDGVALTQGKTALVSLGRFELLDAQADMSGHTLAVGSLSASNPKLRVERDSEKHWMFEHWLKVPAAGGASGTATAKVAGPKTAKTAQPSVDAPGKAKTNINTNINTKPWALTIGAVAVDGGAVSYADKANTTPVAFEITQLKLRAQKVTPDSAAASPLELSGRIGAGRAEPGRFAFTGRVALKPVVAEGRLDLSAIPVDAFKAYYADQINVDVRRAYASYRGTVRYEVAPAGMSIKLAGDTAVDDFRANSTALTQAPGVERGNQLLRWKTLSLRGLQVDLVPRAPIKVDVRETTVTDFFARIIVDEKGHINLQDLAKRPGSGGASARAAAAAPIALAPPAASVAARSGGAPVPAEEWAGAAPAATPAASVAVATAAASHPSSGSAPVINFGPISLVNGTIDFTDHFVKPNYSADLSELTGKLSAFSSQPQGGPGGKPALADLELRGKAEQTASLEITGKLNPLAKPLELDITGKVRDLELPPLSPYSVRYAGHGIERGKLSVDVNYKVTPDGHLTASNKLVLNQLQFGDEVQGSPASLPVKLAVALLADRNGVIDVDLPISGSLNDPQFRLGPVIFKAIVNLIVKAVTAPFSLLSGIGGGSAGEASEVLFAPGSAILLAPAKEHLGKIAKALIDRPKLQMTVSGTANLGKERDAFQRQRLREMVQAEKRRAAARAGQDAAAVTPVTDAEYPALLAALYKRSDITKPRNLIGLAKDLPQKDMENLLLASIPVGQDAMRELAVDRGAAVRDYLLAQKLPGDRLFLGAVRTGAADAKWKPAADLKLDMR